jgi:hypothetical protein
MQELREKVYLYGKKSSQLGRKHDPQYHRKIESIRILRFLVVLE